MEDKKTRLIKAYEFCKLIAFITNAEEIKKHSDSLGSINEKLIFLKDVLSTVKVNYELGCAYTGEDQDYTGDFSKSIKVCEALIRYYETQQELEESDPTIESMSPREIPKIEDKLVIKQFDQMLTIDDKGKKEKVMSKIRSIAEGYKPKDIAILFLALKELHFITTSNITELSGAWYNSFGYRKKASSLTTAIQNHIPDREFEMSNKHSIIHSKSLFDDL